MLLKGVEKNKDGQACVNHLQILSCKSVDLLEVVRTLCNKCSVGHSLQG